MSLNISGNSVLVTGAGGFIGSHLTEQLVREGAKVRAFVRYNSRSDYGLLRLLPNQILNSVEIVSGDLRDEDAIRKAVTKTEIVFHLGALISIPYSYQHPAEVVSSNIIGTMNILLACRDLGVEKVVHTSTSEVYGTAKQVPISEDHPLQGQSPYSASKIGADKMAESFYCAYGLPVVTVRPFNTFGPRQSARAVIPTIITQALSSDVIHLGNLETKRDFTFVSDTVAGFLKAAQSDQGLGQAFNLGTGVEIRIGDVVDLVLNKVQRSVKVDVEEQRLRPDKSEVLRLLSDNSLARKVLKWQPMVSFETGLDRTIKWISENLDRYSVGRYEL